MNTLKSIQYDRINTGPVQKRAFVMIHGWKGNKNSFKSVSNLIGLDNTAWFFPEAPYNFEEDCSKKTWAVEKSPGVWEVDEPRRMLKEFLVDHILSEFDSKDVFVMGFSQGAAVCYEYIMGVEKQFGGIFPIGGFFFKYSKKAKRVSEDNKNTPIIIGHGTKDDIIPIEKSEEAFNQLSKEGANVDIYKYNGGHKISMNFLRRIIEVINGK